MMTTNDVSRNIFPPVPVLELSAAYWRNGMLYSSKVPMLTIHEKTKSETGLRKLFIIIFIILPAKVLIF
jgi:hypothetical protein